MRSPSGLVPLLVSIAGLLVSAGSVRSAEPFAPGDVDAVHSDAAVVRYAVGRACLANLPACLGAGAPTSPCTAGRDLTGLHCGVGIHRFCLAKGHASGWGVERVGDPATVDIHCVTHAAASTSTVDFATLRGFVDTCADGRPSASCSIAIDRFCRDQSGFGAGFGPVERGGDSARVACLRTVVRTGYRVDLIEVEQQVPGCTLAAPLVSTPCRQAMASFCQEQDAASFGGFGPRELGTRINVGCVAARLPWQANATLPASPVLPVDVLDRRLDPASGQGGGAARYLPERVHATFANNRSLSFDGRVRVVAKNGTLQFRVHTPEIFDQPLSQRPSPGRERSYEQGSIADLYGFPVAADAFHASTRDGRLEGKSTALCDPHLGAEPLAQANRQQSVPGRVSNPFACTAQGDAASAGGHDCYDLTVITVYGDGVQDELWGTPVRVVVANPKGAGRNGVPSLGTRAHVVGVRVLDVPRRAPLPLGQPEEMLEPVVTGDGRLLFLQGDGKIQYAVMPASAPACDVTQWSRFRHLYEMHTDPLMAGYGVATFPLRDMENRELSTRVTGSHVIRGAYPWVDRDGDNLIFMLGRANLFYVDPAGQPREKFPVVGHPVFGAQAQIPCSGSSCPASGTLPLQPSDAAEVRLLVDPLPRVGLTVVGLWTQGKLWTPDSRNNAGDLAIPGGAHSHRLLHLYEDEPGGTEIGPTTRTLINALENQLAFRADMRPDTPREVVWHVASQGQTDEIVFDDVGDPAALIVSPMNVAIRATNPDRGRFEDGFVDVGQDGGEGFVRPAKIANAAAATRWRLPAFGALLGGARSEPIAAGGFRGKGLWLDGDDDRLEYLVPAQTASGADAMATSPWFVNLSIDPRDLGVRRRLLTLPDGTWLDVVDARTLRFGKTASVDVVLPPALALAERAWSTIGIVSEPAGGGGVTVRVAIDGYLLASVVSAEPLFRLLPGRLTVGAVAGGFRGWLDDLKVVGRAPGPEVLCNHARGTLIGVEDGDALDARSRAHPTDAHAAITALLPVRYHFPRYACERPIPQPVDVWDAADHGHYHCLGKTRRLDAHPRPERCVRPALLFPEGPLVFGQVRPSSLGNPFCLSCHTDDHPSVTLRATDALSPGAEPMHLDLRRQPLQNSPRIFGNVPALLFGGLPLLPFSTPPEGVFLDAYTAPPPP